MSPRFAILAATAFALAKLNAADRGSVALESVPHSHWHFGGVIGERLDANERQWLLPAPSANPGMLEMFRVRDREPVPKLVPWAGEFAGKYLISAVQAMRMTDRPELRESVAAFTRELLATQADDGYLGPFPKADRLLGNWDLWGHYHVIEGLLLWNEATGDQAALNAAKRIADLACDIFLEGKKRVLDVGSPEMNLAFIHALALLHRKTGEPRYLALAREIEKDWERAGDYLRTGLDGVEFHATPRPRWESLHDLQGLFEMWRITGEAKYRKSFEHHWRSILRGDVHNAGSFSAGEQATGNPWATGAVETCCTIAWMALSIDMLKLTGDPLVADELERSTLNGALGAQHPTGRWWTYNTPMDGTREASAHSIVFQARAGTPELNCCSVNGPRALGMLSDWAVMRSEGGLTINWHGPLEIRLLKDTGFGLKSESDYPVSGHVKWIVSAAPATEASLRFRIPAWSAHTVAKLNGETLPEPKPGTYLDLSRRWKNGDAIEFDFDMSLRVLPGDREALGKVSLFRGPLLLAWDQRNNPFDEAGIPPIALDHLNDAKISTPPNGPLRSWLLVDLPAADGKKIRLCDYASAGATGTRYRSWLPTTQPLPPPPIPRLPADGTSIGSEPITFRWSTQPGPLLTDYTLTVFAVGKEATPLVKLENLTSPEAVVDFSQKLTEPASLRWRVEAHGPGGISENHGPSSRLNFDPVVQAVNESGGVILRAPLQTDAIPEAGHLERATAFTATEAGLQLDGLSQMLVYSAPDTFRGDFTVAVRVRVDELPIKRPAQIFSAWAAPVDDPLRLVIESGALFARIEAQQGYSTDGLPIAVGEWHHIAAVKRADRLTLFIDGEARRTVPVPAHLDTQSTECAIGGNPRHPGPEFLSATFRDLEIRSHALSSAEIDGLARIK